MRMSDLYVMRRLIVPTDSRGGELDDFASYSYATGTGVSLELADAAVFPSAAEANRTLQGDCVAGYRPVDLARALADDRANRQAMAEAYADLEQGTNPHRPADYKGCRIRPESNELGTYFGLGLAGCDDEGYSRHFVRVTFPDQTWVRCANVREARRYIDGPQGVRRHNAIDCYA